MRGLLQIKEVGCVAGQSKETSNAALLRHVQIRVRHVGGEGRTRDTNRQRIVCPRLRSIAPCVLVATDSLNRPYGIGMRGKKIPKSEILDRTLAEDFPNLRSL